MVDRQHQIWIGVALVVAGVAGLASLVVVRGSLVYLVGAVAVAALAAGTLLIGRSRGRTA